MVVSVLLGFAFWFIVAWLAASKFDKIAVLKGYPEKSYFWWCFWLGWMGYLMVIALPDRSGSQAVVSSDELPDL